MTSGSICVNVDMRSDVCSPVSFRRGKLIVTTKPYMFIQSQLPYLSVKVTGARESGDFYTHYLAKFSMRYFLNWIWYYTLLV